ncbi:hypothetical protein SAMN05421853_10294 [Roseivivax halotolerans]|uniref:Uncharacterized protein n=1 Tax=Roseivivax halotolerans TaxID=93684 RepID=A0A1I5W396_9RHOB|nr:hypothetical protein [Roseivivax halotolerans]SFQ14077.1 hypothetical protein SAMN05421853_10294 [Roseivivax halotolerans]
MVDLEILKSVEVVIGLIVLFFGAFAALVRWVWGKVSIKVASSVDPLAVSSRNVVKRLEDVEGDVRALKQQLAAVEKSLGGMARHEDQQKLAITLARVEERSLASDQKLDTLYRAIMDRAPRG